VLTYGQATLWRPSPKSADVRDEDDEYPKVLSELSYVLRAHILLQPPPDESRGWTMRETTNQETAVYRICAGEKNTWNVFQDSHARPLASFEDKSAALTYAMCLARGKVSWQLLLDGRGKNARENAIIGHTRHG
jgi:hypothetical protein